MRDLPLALSAKGWEVTVATPSYGNLQKLPGTRQLATNDVNFRGEPHSVSVWHVPCEMQKVRNIVFHHSLFSEHGTGRIYVGDDTTRPFASDADKFAFFCVAAATWISASKHLPDVVHLHDWHASFYLLLTHYDRDFAALQDIRTVFTIHNLSYQGTRPFSGDESSLAAWYPDLRPHYAATVDPRYDDCVNPMASAIRLADRVSTVSPTYAMEICKPNDPPAGFIGGEGLEDDLIDARDQKRLFGVLNGCYYDQPLGRRPGWQRLLGMIKTQLHEWQEKEPTNPAHALALSRIAAMPKRRPAHLITSIGRFVTQKVTLLLYEFGNGELALERIAHAVSDNGVIILLGSGEAALEERMLQLAERVPNLIFLHGYSEDLAAPLYRGGDLFLMPSSFEPCGISQMLAMRGAQPCVVHGVGGLKDTVEDGVTGFVFGGDTPVAQADDFVDTTAHAIDIRSTDPVRWQSICRSAASRRFDWASSAEQTIQTLYGDANAD